MGLGSVWVYPKNKQSKIVRQVEFVIACTWHLDIFHFVWLDLLDACVRCRPPSCVLTNHVTVFGSDTDDQLHFEY